MGVFFRSYNPAQITTVFGLLALFLLVVQGVLGYWLSKADSPAERIAVGIFIILCFAGFLFVVLSMVRRGQLGTRTEREAGGRGFDPAEEETTPEEISNLRAGGPAQSERIGAPDGSYSIARPREDWTVTEETLGDFLANMYQITDSEARERAFSSQTFGTKVLAMKCAEDVSVVPVMGKTRINGRIYPSAMEVVLSHRLTIIPLDRFQPPLFVELSMQHNILNFLGQVLSPGMFIVREIVPGQTGSGRASLSVELWQEIENVTIDGEADRSVNAHFVLIGIEGELQDHLLLLHYPSYPQKDGLSFDAHLDTLRSIVGSFRPLKPVNPGQRRAEIAQMADSSFTKVLTTMGNRSFYGELALSALRIKGLDLADPVARAKAINMLEPFEAWAGIIDLKNAKMGSLWEALRRAKRGESAADFIGLVDDLIRTVAQQRDNGESPQLGSAEQA